MRTPQSETEIGLIWIINAANCTEHYGAVHSCDWQRNSVLQYRKEGWLVVVQITTVQLFFFFFSVVVVLPHEIPFIHGQIVSRQLNSGLGISGPDVQGRVSGLRSIKYSSGPDVFGTLYRVEWPFPQMRKKKKKTQIRPTEIKELRTYPPKKYELSKPLIRLFVCWHRGLYNTL